MTEQEKKEKELELLELEEAEANKTEAPSKLSSALHGLGQGASFGFSDELEAMVRAANPETKYQDALKEVRARYKKAQETNPKTYGAADLAGNIGTSFIPVLGIPKGAGLVKTALKSAAQGGAASLGYSEGDATEQLQDAAKGAGMGAVFGSGGKLVEKALSPVAERLALNATGATGREAEKFQKGAGRKLLDMGLVSFGDDARNVAEKSNTALKNASEGIGDSLRTLDKASDGVSRDQVLANLITERAKLSGNEAKSDVISKIDKIIERFSKSDQKRSFSDLWNVKKGFDEKVNWKAWQEKPNATQANYLASKAVRNAVADTAQAELPEIAKKFSDERNLFSLVKPINNASQRRASTLNQQQFGNLLDLAAIGAGGTFDLASGDSSLGSTGKALAAVGARRYLLPRAASSAAVALDRTIPQLSLTYSKRKQENQ